MAHTKEQYDPYNGSNLQAAITAHGIEIWYKGRPLIRHTTKHPAVALGRGEADFRMYHGNFRIRPGFVGLRRCAGLSVAGDIASKDELRLVSPDCGLELRLVEEGERLLIEPRVADTAINRFSIRLASAPGEHFYGCGEQYSRLDLAGSRVPLWSSEQGVGRGHDLITLFANLHSKAGGAWHTTYFPVPAFVASSGWFCAADSSSYAEFDFRRRGEIELAFCEVPERIVIGRVGPVVAAPRRPGSEAGPDGGRRTHTGGEQTTVGGLREAVSALGSYQGLQPPLPDWTYEGMWLGVQGGSERIEQKLRGALEAGVKVSALWAQDWEGKRETAFGRQLVWNWRFDEKLYPRLPEQIAGLRERGVRVLGYINTFLAVEGDLYREASKRGFCVKNRAGEDYLVVVTTFPAAMLDLTNPEAVAWIKEVIKQNMIGIGLSGWMADFGEYLPTDAVLSSGESPELVHNRFPALWAKANREAVEEAGALGEVVFFMRAGYTGSTRYSTAFWAGDQLVSFSRHDGLPSVIPAALSLGMVGGGITHSDLGGYTTLAWVKRTKELFQRWAEHAAFTPIMRTHEGNRPDSNWQFNSDRETLAHLARMTRIYVALKPYHKRVVADYCATGIPPMRHLLLAQPADASLSAIQDEYLYGDELLVAPLLRKGARKRAVSLPEGDWVHLWSGTHYGRGRHTISAPIGYPPAFYRSGGEHTELFQAIAHIKPGESRTGRS